MIAPPRATPKPKRGPHTNPVTIARAAAHPTMLLRTRGIVRSDCAARSTSSFFMLPLRDALCARLGLFAIELLEPELRAFGCVVDGLECGGDAEEGADARGPATRMEPTRVDP